MAHCNGCHVATCACCALSGASDSVSRWRARRPIGDGTKQHQSGDSSGSCRTGLFEWLQMPTGISWPSASQHATNWRHRRRLTGRLRRRGERGIRVGPGDPMRPCSRPAASLHWATPKPNRIADPTTPADTSEDASILLLGIAPCDSPSPAALIPRVHTRPGEQQRYACESLLLTPLPLRPNSSWPAIASKNERGRENRGKMGSILFAQRVVRGPEACPFLRAPTQVDRGPVLARSH